MLDLVIMVLAQAAPTSGDPTWIRLIDYGIGGLLILLLLTKQFALFREVTSAREETAQSRADAQQARAELMSLQAAMIDDLVPALTRVTDVTARAAKALASRGLDDGG